MERPNKEEYYLNIALDVAKRSTCLRRQYGAVIVKDDRIISTGYNGAPRGRMNCTELGKCVRQDMNIPSGERYELCRSVHAEQNAIIHATYSEMQGATMYLAGIEIESGKQIDFPDCCAMCKRVVINAGIKYIVFGNADGTFRKVLVKDWTVFMNDDSIPKVKWKAIEKKEESVPEKHELPDYADIIRHAIQYVDKNRPCTLRDKSLATPSFIMKEIARGFAEYSSEGSFDKTAIEKWQTSLKTLPISKAHFEEWPRGTNLLRQIVIQDKGTHVELEYSHPKKMNIPNLRRQSVIVDKALYNELLGAIRIYKVISTLEGC